MPLVLALHPSSLGGVRLNSPGFATNVESVASTVNVSIFTLGARWLRGLEVVEQFDSVNVSSSSSIDAPVCDSWFLGVRRTPGSWTWRR